MKNLILFISLFIYFVSYADDSGLRVFTKDTNKFTYDATIADTTHTFPMILEDSVGFTYRLAQKFANPGALIIYTGSGYIDTFNDTLYEADHGYETGLIVTVSTDGTLPSPLTATEYYVGKVDSDFFRLFTTEAYAVAGTPSVDFTDIGAPTGAAHTFTATTAGGYSTLQYSVDNSNWTDIASIDGDSASTVSTVTNVFYDYVRLVTTATGGQLSVDFDLNHK